MNDANPKESLRALLAEIVDYAGLFPPSHLSMAESANNYAAYKNSRFKWMLGRFIVPVSRLDEFAEIGKDLFSSNREVWKLSVLAGEDIYETVQRIDEFNGKFAANAIADALEIKAANALEIENIAAHIPENLNAYFELPLDENLSDSIATLAVTKHRAKIRTGGITTEAFPTVEQITRFMQICFAAYVPFKATAGLHHPLRSQRSLTYEKDAPTGIMNGFLNVFLAAGFVQQGFKPKLIRELLLDQREDNFLCTDDGVLWRQEYFISTSQLKNLRARGAISFGSCSFVGPIDDLKEIGIL